MKPGMPPHVWVKNRDGTMKLVAREDLLKAMDGLKDHANGFQPPKPAEVVQPGLGTLVAKTLAAVGVRKKAGCNCDKRQAAMDRATPAWLRAALKPLVLPAAAPASSTPRASHG